MCPTGTPPPANDTPTNSGQRGRAADFTPRAAFIYLHATREHDQKIAGMGKLFVAAKKAQTQEERGTKGR